MVPSLGVWVADYIRETSGDPSVDLVLITTMISVLLLAAVLQAVMIGDLIYKRRWRERYLLLLDESTCALVGGVHQGIDTDCEVEGCPEVCHDVNGDGLIGIDEILYALDIWGPCP